MNAQTSSQSHRHTPGTTYELYEMQEHDTAILNVYSPTNLVR